MKSKATQSLRAIPGSFAEQIGLRNFFPRTAVQHHPGLSATGSGFSFWRCYSWLRWVSGCAGNISFPGTGNLEEG